MDVRTPVPTRPHPIDRTQLRVRVGETKRNLSRAVREEAALPVKAKALFAYLVAKLSIWRPARTLQLYSRRRGPLMAAGVSYRMFFSVVALLAVGFSIFGLIATGNTGLQSLIISAVDESTPGLIDTGNGGLAKPEELFASNTRFGWALVISTATMLITSLRWIAGLRDGMRGVFDLPPVVKNPLIKKLNDLGALLLLGVALVVTSIVAAVTNTAVKFVTDLLNFTGALAVPLTSLAGIMVMLLLDMAVAVVLFRLVSGITMPRIVMLQSALIAGLGSTLLRTSSSLLLQSVDKNPLLATIAVIPGLFVWFFLLSQVYLLATAWGAVGTADHEAVRNRERRGVRRLSLRQRARIGQHQDP
ncbi:hypothetical protein GCM10009611_22580 [Arthrobacter roseus]